METKPEYSLPYFKVLLEAFLTNGQLPDENAGIPLYTILLQLKQNPEIYPSVLTHKVKRQVLFDTLVQFIQGALDQYHYQQQRSLVEQDKQQQIQEWNINQRKANGAELLDFIAKQYPDCFPHEFYQTELLQRQNWEDEDLWLKLSDDWQKAHQFRLNTFLEHYFTTKVPAVWERLSRTLVTIPAFLEENHVDDDVFLQAWCTMGGLWNTVDFKRMQSVIGIQKQYPVLLEVANHMGRTPDASSKESNPVAAASSFKLEHASKSDILGITTGNDLSSLLPQELVLAADKSTESLFLYKYAAKGLQNFNYKSEIFKPVNKLAIKRARNIGPMIVCIDTSGSMEGIPQHIGRALLVKLLQIADAQNRRLYLIAFSVSAQPIDVGIHRTQLLELFNKPAQGDTDGTRMLEQTFSLLQQNTEFMSSDVLWITDFKIPLVNSSLLSNILSHRLNGTQFYGLQIGVVEQNKWKPYFDKIWHLAYKWPKKLGK